MSTPTSRREFERNLNLLKEKLENGKVHLPMDRRVTQSLLDVRLTPNGRINFYTVNEATRSLANTISHFEDGQFNNSEDEQEN